MNAQLLCGRERLGWGCGVRPDGGGLRAGKYGLGGGGAEDES